MSRRPRLSPPHSGEEQFPNVPHFFPPRHSDTSLARHALHCSTSDLQQHLQGAPLRQQSVHTRDSDIMAALLSQGLDQEVLYPTDDVASPYSLFGEGGAQSSRMGSLRSDMLGGARSSVDAPMGTHARPMGPTPSQLVRGMVSNRDILDTIQLDGRPSVPDHLRHMWIDLLEEGGESGQHSAQHGPPAMRPLSADQHDRRWANMLQSRLVARRIRQAGRSNRNRLRGTGGRLSRAELQAIRQG